jgi:hypothetical protein
MILSVLMLLCGAARAAAPVQKADPHPEQTLREKLVALRQNHLWEIRKAMIGEDGDLRDAVKSNTGAVKVELANRLPGMSPEPFDLCRDLAHCPEAPQSLHVEDETLIDDALQALARPWFSLQKARGKTVAVTVDPGVGVQLDLSDLPDHPTVTLQVWPAGTGGFDVLLDDGPEAAKAYAAARQALLAPAAAGR